MNERSGFGETPPQPPRSWVEAAPGIEMCLLAPQQRALLRRLEKLSSLMFINKSRVLTKGSLSNAERSSATAVELATGVICSLLLSLWDPWLLGHTHTGGHGHLLCPSAGVG